MTDVLISSEQLLDRLGHEVLNLKRLGLVNQAQGMQSAVAMVIKAVHMERLPQEQPSLEPST
jgi:ABC-type proline/glycine betaine transport system permease subunit